MRKYRRHLIVALGVALAAGLTCVFRLAASGSTVAGDKADIVDRPPQIQPDYANAVIPPNIAPLNFLVRENGSRYLVRIRSQQGRAIEITSRSGRIEIPEKRWHELLGANRGGRLTFEVSVQSDGAWRQFSPFHCTIAKEDIDNYLAYRRIHPVHAAWRDMGIYQRDLRSFKESIILTNEYFGEGCVNCHTFCSQRTETMLVSTRSKAYNNAAMIFHDGAVV